MTAVTPDWAGNMTAVNRPDITADIALSRVGTGAIEIIWRRGRALKRTDNNLCGNRFHQSGFCGNGSFGLISIDIGNFGGDLFQAVLAFLNYLFIAGFLVLVHLSFGGELDFLLLSNGADNLGLQEWLFLRDYKGFADQHGLADLWIQVQKCLGWDVKLVGNIPGSIAFLNGIGLLAFDNGIQFGIDAV